MSQEKRALQWVNVVDNGLGPLIYDLHCYLALDRSARLLTVSCAHQWPNPSPRDITPRITIITISLRFITFLAVLRSQLCFCNFCRQCFGISVCLFREFSLSA